MEEHYYTTTWKKYQVGILYSASNWIPQGTEQIQNADVHIHKPILKSQYWQVMLQ